MKDTNTEAQLPQDEVISKITLVVSERVSDQAISISTQFNKASTTLLVQSIAYMLDSAFNGNEEAAGEVAGMLPGVVKKYFELKNADEVQTEPEAPSLDLKDWSDDDIADKLRELIDTEMNEHGVNFFMRLSSEVARRSLKGESNGNGEGN